MSYGQGPRERLYRKDSDCTSALAQPNPLWLIQPLFSCAWTCHEHHGTFARVSNNAPKCSTCSTCASESLRLVCSGNSGWPLRSRENFPHTGHCFSGRACSSSRFHFSYASCQSSSSITAQRSRDAGDRGRGSSVTNDDPALGISSESSSRHPRRRGRGMTGGPGSQGRAHKAGLAVPSRRRHRQGRAARSRGHAGMRRRESVRSCTGGERACARAPAADGRVCAGRWVQGRGRAPPA